MLLSRQLALEAEEETGVKFRVLVVPLHLKREGLRVEPKEINPATNLSLEEDSEARRKTLASVNSLILA